MNGVKGQRLWRNMLNSSLANATLLSDRSIFLLNGCAAAAIVSSAWYKKKAATIKIGPTT
jgi:hypothetical protein